MIASSSLSDQSARHRTLRLPELLRIICGFLPREHCAHLLYLSRFTYACALPTVWEEVDFRSVLLLIPGATVTRSRRDDLKLEYVFNFPSAINLTRFNIHSPFVKTLRTSGSYIIYFPNEWRILESQTASKPLLPNLQLIAINTFSSTEPEHVGWIPRLLHPGLRGLEMHSLDLEKNQGRSSGVHSWLDRVTCFELVNQLSRTCPRIETLQLYPAKLGEYDKIQYSELYDSIATLTYLRSFTFGGSVLHQELLQVLGRLPYLETLSLRTDSSQDWVFNQDDIYLPDDSFPSLQHLDLHHLDDSTVSRICNIPQLFRHLTTVNISHREDYDDKLSEKKRSNAVVACLGKNSPHVQHLTVLPRGETRGCFVVSWSTIDAFKSMPLRYLRLGGIRLDPSLSSDSSGEAPQHHGPEINWEHLLAAVPHLEELHIETQTLEPQELQLFASRLPRLRLLVFKQVELDKGERSAEAVNANQPIVLRCWSYFGSFSTGWRIWHPRVPDVAGISDAVRLVNRLTLLRIYSILG
ncbi:hypothetical protein FRC08_009575 [Ceratobasidium sp. 394]|nr:hypothetical protein FRC08_009575 [Ceratobasidium sp. 394]